MLTLPMNRHRGGAGCNSQERFRLRFQRRLLEALTRLQSTAEAFGPTWEATLQEVPLADRDQGPVYRQLIEWAKSDELFTAAQREMLDAWKETVHEL